ncbi:MAG: phosphoglycerate kinase [Euryarchaeota archaeon]|nr:phosphoglycerate kinase [Euryarchaeota archaeon]|tara:strand:+ start:17509 stop:18768 length:1260 start_codon:yes stop_codon:yes gene_type:complete
MASVLTLDNVNTDGKTVLVRVDINSPLDPVTKTFLDDTRIRAIVPTLNRLTTAKVVLLAHQSRPGKNDFTSTLGHSRELGRILGRPVRWVDDLYGEKAMNAIESIDFGDILMLNNVRMYDEEMKTKGGFSTQADTNLVQNLASVADLFVYDAFACAHRSTPSGVGFTHLIPCVAGELMKNELMKLDRALENPARPCIAVLGGIKVDDSIGVADNMLRNNICDEVWPTGGVANLLLELSGVEIGAMNHDFLVNELGKNWYPTVATAKSLLVDFKEKIRLPVDVAANIEDNRVDLTLDKLPVEAPLFDIGIQSVLNLSSAIRRSGTIHLNGPAGVFEVEDFAFGTVEMLNACAESDGYVVVGGGHTATLIMKRGLAHRMGHVSTGGGACLDYIAGRTLPAVASLEASAEAFSMNVARSVDQ